MKVIGVVAVAETVYVYISCSFLLLKCQCINYVKYSSEKIS